jgi:hypothetical protein
MRVNADGNADPSFGDAGVIRLPSGCRRDASSPSGKIVIAGVTMSSTTSSSLLSSTRMAASPKVLAVTRRRSKRLESHLAPQIGIITDL